MKRRLRKCLACLCVMMMCAKMVGAYEVVEASGYAANAETTGAEEVGVAEELSLHKKNPEENALFGMNNMFPGDSKTQYYRVSVSYTGTITVKFQMSTTGDEKLGEALKVKVYLPDSEEVLYEGSLAEMPALGKTISTDRKSLTEELSYAITVSLSADVGNEYQEKQLTADLHWWAEGTPGSTEESTEGSTDQDESEESTEAGSGDGELTDPPATGDDRTIWIWVIALCASMIVFTVLRYQRKRHSGISGGIIMVIILALGLSTTSMALVYHEVEIKNNQFVTGKVSVCINDDQPIFDDDMFFVPGMMVEREFTLRNDSTCDVHYRLYFTNVEGELAKTLQVEVWSGETELFSGTLAEMNGIKSEGADGTLAKGEERIMTIVFSVPVDCENTLQNCAVDFDLNADVVQTVNNLEGSFQ